MKEKMRNNKGITLVALVVTIVIILILSTITINAAIGKNGLIEKAKEAKLKGEQLEADSDARMNDILAEYNNAMAEDSLGGGSTNPGGDNTNETGGNTTDPDNPPTPEEPKTEGPNGKPLPGTVTDTNHDTIQGEDSLGNPVTIPGGFKIADDSGSTVEEGIVVEDELGNQFVWIPISNIDGDGVVDNQSASGLITKSDGSKVQITLGRYTFDGSTGNPILQQKGSSYTTNLTVSSYYRELNTYRSGYYENSSTYQGATAKNLSEFMESAIKNRGYYFARYESSIRSGSSVGEGASDNYYKLASVAGADPKVFSKQHEAATACRNMYYGASNLKSDLCNSYAWDTAIVYIQAMGNDNYATEKRGINLTKKNTGATGDEKCHIFDMAANLYEWSTEESSRTSSGYSYLWVTRGGSYNDADRGTCARWYVAGAQTYTGYTGCRVLTYIPVSASN